jgi:hypothetical protein
MGKFKKPAFLLALKEAPGMLQQGLEAHHYPSNTRLYSNPLSESYR